MRRLVFHLAIACLTFLVGSFIAVSYRFLMTAYESQEVEENEVTYVEASQLELRVYDGMSACGPTANYHTYVASDGAELSSSCIRMASAKRAAQEVKRRVAFAKEILERHEDRNEDGSLVRERIVLVNVGGIVSLSVSGSSYCEIKAPSLKHLQALQRR